MLCTVEGCTRPLNRDGLCFHHKIQNVRIGGIHRLKREREEGYTQADLKRDIYFEARRTGRDIKRAGSVSPTSGGLLT